MLAILLHFLAVAYWYIGINCTLCAHHLMKAKDEKSGGAEYEEFFGDCGYLTWIMGWPLFFHKAAVMQCLGYEPVSRKIFFVGEKIPSTVRTAMRTIPGGD